MIDALLMGTLFGSVERRESKTGKPFWTAKVRTPMQDGESVLAGLIAFKEDAGRALMALSDGDSIAVAGELSIATYTAKDGSVKPSVRIAAHSVLTAYHVARKRQAMRAGEEGNG